MNKVVAFVLGAAAGSLITWKLIEKKYKDLTDEEIEAVKEYYKNKEEKVVELSVKVDELDKTKTEYTKVINDSGYASSRTVEYTEDEDGSVYVEPGEEKIAPYTITVDEYGENDDYEIKSWSYYADFVLTDENEEIIGDSESIIGDILTEFDSLKDNNNAVYIRNDNTMCDYEIIKYDQTFNEVNGVE